MIRILLIRNNVENLSDGISSYCDAIYEMFRSDGEIEVLKAQNYPIIKVAAINDLYLPKDIKYAIRESNADVVHINGYTSACTLQAIYYSHKYGKRIIYTPHWHPFSFLRRPLFAKLLFILCVKPFVNHYVDTIIGINNDDTSYFSSFRPPVVQIPHWPRLTEPRIAINVEKKENMVLFVGRVNSANKGIEHLFSLPEGKYDIHIVGSGTLSCRRDMVFHNSISDAELYVLYREASLVVVPSSYEAFSYVALESLCAGTPVVASNGVHIGDYLLGFPFYTKYEYGNFQQFILSVENTIGVDVDIEKVNSIFNLNKAALEYKKIYKNTLPASLG